MLTYICMYDININIFDIFDINIFAFFIRSVQKMSLGGWCAEDSDNNPFLQVDLVNNTIVTALATQGLPGNENSALRYKLNYRCDGKVWFEYQQGKVILNKCACMSQFKCIFPLVARKTSGAHSNMHMRSF